MHVKVLTLAYDAGVRGFPADAVERLGGIGNILEVRDHFFVHQGVPHLTLVVLLDEGNERTGPRREQQPDPENDLPEEVRSLYRNLRRWRNERAKTDGVPAYAIFRNTQLAEICKRRPDSLAALREIEGIGDATCGRYGQEVLNLVREAPSGPSRAAEAPK